MNNPDFLELFNRYREGAPTVVGAGRRGRELRTIAGDDLLVFYGMDMPYATPIALGMARASKMRKVVALEGDGNLLAGLAGLSTIARYQPRNLVVVVCDNESYASFGTGAVASATASGVDLAAVARGCGIGNAHTVRTLEEAETVLRRAFSEPGPWVVVAKVENLGDADSRFWIDKGDVIDNGFTFRQALDAQASGAEPRAGARL